MRMARSINHLDAASFQAQQPLLNQPQSQQQQYLVVLPPYPPPHRHLLLTKSCRRCLFCLAILLLYLIAAAYLLWPSHPALSILNLRLARLRFRTDPEFSRDITIDLNVRVWNPDVYSMDYDSLLVAIGYRGERLGLVTLDGGRIERLEFSYFNAALELHRVEILSGVITLDVESEITGKLGVFVFDLPLKTKTQCAVTVDVYNQKIHRQSCHSEASEVKW